MFKVSEIWDWVLESDTVELRGTLAEVVYVSKISTSKTTQYFNYLLIIDKY